MSDRVFQTDDGWFCAVNGKTYGSWATRSIALAGMQVEQARVKKMGTVTITVEKGAVTGVEGVDYRARVLVRDFDIQDVDPDNLPEGFGKTDTGKIYQIIEIQGGK
jgi:hypothetical protein